MFEGFWRAATESTFLNKYLFIEEKINVSDEFFIQQQKNNAYT
jgi:hypothetical protein